MTSYENIILWKSNIIYHLFYYYVWRLFGRLFYPVIRVRISFVNVMIIPPAKVRNPLGLFNFFSGLTPCFTIRSGVIFGKFNRSAMCIYTHPHSFCFFFLWYIGFAKQLTERTNIWKILSRNSLIWNNEWYMILKWFMLAMKYSP